MNNLKDIFREMKISDNRNISVREINIVNPVDFDDVKNKMKKNYGDLFSNELRISGGSIK